MEKTELVKFKCTLALRRALKLRAALEDNDMTDVIIAALEVHLEEELAAVKSRGMDTDGKE